MIRRAVVTLAGVLAVVVLAAGCARDAGEVPYADGYQPTTTIGRSDVRELARYMTYRIRAVGCSNLMTGSGFAVSPTVIVTNRHVVEGAVRIELSSWDGRSVVAAASVEVSDHDLAFIRTDRPLPAWGVLGAAAVGDKVWAVGYPEGGALTLTDGMVSGIVNGSAVGESGELLEITSEVRSGNSGGPLVDQDGLVVGVVFAYGRDTGKGYAIDAQDVQALLDVPSNSPLPPPCQLGQPGQPNGTPGGAPL